MGKTVIGICDDQDSVVQILQEHVEAVMQEIANFEWEVKTYVHPRKLLEDIKRIHVLFLDIEMPELDGIEVGRQIISQNPQCKILMASSRIDRFKEAFQIDAVRFVTKPFFRNEIKEALLAVFTKKAGSNEIEVFRDRASFCVKECDISMIRAFNGYVEVFVGNSVFRKDISLNSLEKELDQRIFFRINRQYLINLGHVKSYHKNTIKVDEEKFLIAVRRQKDFFVKYTEYDLNYR